MAGGCGKQVYMRTAAIVMAISQIIFIILTGIMGKYSDSAHPAGKVVDEATAKHFSRLYPKFQDVNVMIFIGFGFLMTFLKRYGFSSFGFNMLLSAFVIQWASILHGIGEAIMHHESHFKFTIETMFASEFAAATVLISFGAVLGKTNVLQLLVMAFCEVIFQYINERIVIDHIKITDIGGSLVVHAFGAYFGLAVARVIYNKASSSSPKEGTVYHSDIFSYIGTAFLWVYWPSFNGALVEGAREQRAIINTFYALVACTVTTFLMSILVSKDAKIEAAHIQNSTLAGGVAVGTASDLLIHPYGAMLIGVVAGVLSTLGFRFITPFMSRSWKVHDTCGVNNLHGMPGLLAGIAAAVTGALATVETYGKNELHEIFEARAPFGNSTESRSASAQGGFQLLAVVCTFVIAILSGALTGFILKAVNCFHGPKDEDIMDDQKYWDIPDTGYPGSDARFDGKPLTEIESKT